MSGGGRPPVAPRLPLPQSAAHPRLHPHRSLLHHVRLGFVSTQQRRRQTAPRPRSSRTFATLCRAHRRQSFRSGHRAPSALRTRHHSLHRSPLHPLPLLRTAPPPPPPPHHPPPHPSPPQLHPPPPP